MIFCHYYERKDEINLSMHLYEIGIELTLSTKMNYRKEISKEEIANLPHGKYTGNIHLINSRQEADSALEELMYSKIIGIDTSALLFYIDINSMNK